MKVKYKDFTIESIRIEQPLGKVLSTTLCSPSGAFVKGNYDLEKTSVVDAIQVMKDFIDGNPAKALDIRENVK